jgi:hypothetical protein
MPSSPRLISSASTAGRHEAQPWHRSPHPWGVLQGSSGVGGNPLCHGTYPLEIILARHPSIGAAVRHQEFVPVTIK